MKNLFGKKKETEQLKCTLFGSTDKFKVTMIVRYTGIVDTLIWDNDPKLGLGVTSKTIYPPECKIRPEKYLELPKNANIDNYLKPFVINALVESKESCLRDKSFIVNEFEKYKVSKDKLQIRDVFMKLTNLETVNGFNIYRTVYYNVNSVGKAHYELTLEDLKSEDFLFRREK